MAHILVYEIEILGDGSLPTKVAASVEAPTLSYLYWVNPILEQYRKLAREDSKAQASFEPAFFTNH